MPWDYFFHANHRFYWVYIISSAVLALLVLMIKDHRLPEKKSWKTYWLHPGALLDYRYFIVVWLIKVYLIAPLLLSYQAVSLWVLQGLSSLHSPLFLMWSYQKISIAYAFSLFLVSDFTRYWLHRIVHRSKTLWWFHAVHHSVEVLNPFSFYRVHPIENFLFGLRYALSSGLVTGLFMWLFGGMLGLYTILGANAFVVFFSFVGANLRHTHIYLRYPSWLEHIIMSPAQHQLHHTAEYSQKNYGSALSLWDTLFGSLKTTKNVPQPTEFGFSQKRSQHYYTIRGLIFQPFIDLYDQHKEVGKTRTHPLTRSEMKEKTRPHAEL